jgi:Domain of unknown function (DUF4832)
MSSIRGPESLVFFAVALASCLACGRLDDVVFTRLAGPAGPPDPPAPSVMPPVGLARHALELAESPPDNPDKGLLPYYVAGGKPGGGFPHSLEWSYLGLDTMMMSFDTFDWKVFDAMLDDVSLRGMRLAVRPYIEYPGKPSALPEFLKGSVAIRRNDVSGTDSPDYDEPLLVRALERFIAVFGARYDGDPRLAYVQLGLIGLWGEWQTWPYDGTAATGRPSFMPTVATQTTLVDAYRGAFTRTPLEVRFASTAGGHAVAVGVGLHDNSWCYRESRQGSAPLGTTLPVSLGGWGDSFLQVALDAGAENTWVAATVGGEVRTEIQSALFSGGAQVDALSRCVDLTHASWLVDDSGVAATSPTDTTALALVRRLGYELSVTAAYFDESALAGGAAATVALSIENHGVARFPSPWPVVLGVRDAVGTVEGTVMTDWDLRSVQPAMIAAFPDWALPGSPDDIAFAAPVTFIATVPLAGLPTGDHELVVRVQSPLEARTPAGKRLRFANATQETTGDAWLVLAKFRR